MAASPKPTIAQNRLATTIAISLLTLAACAWIATYYLMPLLMIQSQSGMEGSSISAIVAPPSVLSVSIYGAIWVLGMVAMMFPAMIPIVLFYNKIVAKQERSPSLAKLVGTLLFLGGYLIVYVVLGICAYLVVYAAINLSMQFSELALLSAAASGAILIATGIYQFTSLKSACLKNCISPIAFFTVHHKTGLFGSFENGSSTWLLLCRMLLGFHARYVRCRSDEHSNYGCAGWHNCS